MARNQRKTVVGTVVSDKMDKTITVRVERLEKHPLYKKYVKRFTTYKAHDENNDAGMGDPSDLVASSCHGRAAGASIGGCAPRNAGTSRLEKSPFANAASRTRRS